MKKIALILIFALHTNIAYSITGSKVYEFCTFKTEVKMVCDAMIIGSVDGLMTMNNIDRQLYPKMFNKPFCIPNDVPPRDVADVVIKHLNNYPEDRSQTIGFITLIALSKAFPCDQSLITN
jgi:hypothetical protein